MTNFEKWKAGLTPEAVERHYQSITCETVCNTDSRFCNFPGITVFTSFVEWANAEATE